MAKYLGNNLTLAVESSPASGTYNKIGGSSEHTFTINNEPVDVSDKDSNRWVELLAAGARSLAISMSGFVSSDANYAIMDTAIKNDVILNYQLTFGNSETVTGAFHVASKDIAGAKNDAQSFSVSFASSGIPTFA